MHNLCASVRSFFRGDPWGSEAGGGGPGAQIRGCSVHTRGRGVRAGAGGEVARETPVGGGVNLMSVGTWGMS